VTVERAGRVAVFGAGPLSRDLLLAVARDGARVVPDDDLDVRLAKGAQRVAEAVAGEAPVYGVNTGFGALADKHIGPDDARELQAALLRSHAAGSGDPLPRAVVRAVMAIRAATLARGFSGARPELVRAIIALLNADLVPVVPELGSLGASGDLAPLAHTFITLMGEGRFLDGRSLADAGLEPLLPAPKEGLALTNGTDAMLAAGVLVSAEMRTLLRTCDIAAALSVEALLGTDRAFGAEINALRPHPGQQASAANLRALLGGSGIVSSHRASHHAVQDAYSLRCTPQVHGACRDLATFADDVFGRELESLIDNPVVFPDTGDVVSAGNFHGEPLAFAHDMLAIAMAELAAISERRLNRLLDPKLSRGLPAFLSPREGINSGLMLAQYTAGALLTDLRLNAQPASIHNVSTSGGQEDHVSMGWTAARQAMASVDLAFRAVAVELMAGCEALERRAPLRPGPATAAVLRVVRDRVAPLREDRELAPDLAAVAELARSGEVVAAAETATSGPLL